MDSLNHAFKVLIFVAFLIGFIYPSFFLEEGRFFNSTLSEIEKTTFEHIQIKSEINAIDTQLKELTEVTEKNKVTPQEYISELEALSRNARLKYESLDYQLGLLHEKQEELKANGHFSNIFYVIRALSLGALGAMLTLITRPVTNSASPSRYESIFTNQFYWQLLISSVLSGALISVVVFSMFYSNQLSIFINENTPSSTAPSFWRITLVCLVSGAFAEKIYQAISGKVTSYTQQQAHNKSIQPNAKASAD
ncbi:MAG: hypothetical protein ABJK64_13600 [Paraglaciecola sp.]|uniref:hypothetical protein n=1 Tax=Paraglaciecola sp. TaxID=1920173 RepID=UPI003299B189